MKIISRKAIPLSVRLRSIIRMDEWIDWLLREETICDVGAHLGAISVG